MERKAGDAELLQPLPLLQGVNAAALLEQPLHEPFQLGYGGKFALRGLPGLFVRAAVLQQGSDAHRAQKGNPVQSVKINQFLVHGHFNMPFLEKPLLRPGGDGCLERCFSINPPLCSRCT